jgi:leucyl/phenylalanyl-tRNA--protein transferase
MAQRLGPDQILALYRRGVFPMANDALEERLFIVDPHWRGVLPLHPFRIPARLRRTVRADPFQVTVDQAFGDVMRACAAPAPGRATTWINDAILDAYAILHRQGFAHSVECWREGALVGGLYGVALGAAFFGESMFSRETDASKVALVHLAARLQAGGYRLLDAQFHTAHLSQFGCVEISRAAFRRLLADALKADGDFTALPSGLTGAQLLQSTAHTS